MVNADSPCTDGYQATYDALGRRISTLDEGVLRYYLYDGDTIVAELDANGNPLTEYTWGLLGPIARLDLQNPSNNRYYVLDGLGHTRPA